MSRLNSNIKVWVEEALEKAGDVELFIRFSNAKFSGESFAWFSWHELKIFSEELAHFPLSSDGIEIEAGVWEEDCPQLKEVHVGLQCIPLGMTGDILFRIKLLDPIADKPFHFGTDVSVMVKYQDVNNLSSNLELLLKGDITAFEMVL